MAVALVLTCGCSAADRLCRSGAVDLICIDSVSALTPRAEIEVYMSVFYGIRQLGSAKVTYT